MPMNEKLQLAHYYQSIHEPLKANELMIELINEQPTNAYYHYECARTYDVLNNTYAAIFHYEQAIAMNIAEPYFIPTSLKLFTHFRSLQNHEKALHIISFAIKKCPHNITLKIFHQLGLYNYHLHLKNELVHETNSTTYLS